MSRDVGLRLRIVESRKSYTSLLFPLLQKRQKSSNWC